MVFSSGSTLGLDFSKGLEFADTGFRSTSFSVHPTEDTGHFTLVVSFSRHVFRLDDHSVAAALEAADGGSAIELGVSCLRDKVYSFNVSSKQVGFFIVDLRSFACPQFKCYFNLWGRGGPNWVREFKLWKLQSDAEWILVSPSKRRAALGMIAMHKPPSKSSFRSSGSVQKKISFATFQSYDACKGYRYPATQDCIDTVSDAGYVVSANERLIIRPSPPANLQWTVASPSIVFGSVDPPRIQRNSPEAVSLFSSALVSPASHVGPALHDGLQPTTQPMDIPSTQEAADLFDEMVNDMVDRVLTCSNCHQRGHLSVSCPVCLACSRYGHRRRDCINWAQDNGYVWRVKHMKQNPEKSPLLIPMPATSQPPTPSPRDSSGIETTHAPVQTSPITSSPLPMHHQPAPPPPEQTFPWILLSSFHRGSSSSMEGQPACLGLSTLQPLRRTIAMSSLPLALLSLRRHLDRFITSGNWLVIL